MQFPIFIICRDRLTCTLQLIDWLERAGQERIYLADNDSSYEPWLEYLDETPHNVINMPGNAGHTGLWNHNIIEQYTAWNEFFVVTDPDVIPIEECPMDAVDYFYSLLQQYPDRTKAGFNLVIDDIPDHFKFKQEVINHESQYSGWHGPTEEILYAPIDTTFALYRPGAPHDFSWSIRTKHPYVARHMPWYIDSNNLDEEEIYYREHANKAITSWNKDELPGWIR